MAWASPVVGNHRRKLILKRLVSSGMDVGARSTKNEGIAQLDRCRRSTIEENDRNPLGVIPRSYVRHHFPVRTKLYSLGSEVRIPKS